MEKQEIEDYKKAGEIAKQVVEYAKSIIKPNLFLLEIAEKIESKIIEFGGELAFPVNLSIDEVAAHYTPTLVDKSVAKGLLKVDIGVHINGAIADTAFTIDLTEKKEHKDLIDSVEASLQKVILLLNKCKADTKLNEIGKTIHSEITNKGFSPVKNLSGHGLEQYNIHSKPTISNYDNQNEREIGEGAFAIEPFATTGLGEVYESGTSNIYALIKRTPIRDLLSREIFNYIEETKKTLPFSEREIEKKFGLRAKFALKKLVDTGAVHSFPQLIEKSKKAVAQAEHTAIIFKGLMKITTN